MSKRTKKGKENSHGPFCFFNPCKDPSCRKIIMEARKLVEPSPEPSHVSGSRNDWSEVEDDLSEDSQIPSYIKIPLRKAQVINEIFNGKMPKLRTKKPKIVHREDEWSALFRLEREKKRAKRAKKKLKVIKKDTEEAQKPNVWAVFFRKEIPPVISMKSDINVEAKNGDNDGSDGQGDDNNNESDGSED